MKRKVKSAAGKILGTIRANGAWLFAVQAFGARGTAPILLEFRTVDQLKGVHRRKAELWLEFLA